MKCWSSLIGVFLLSLSVSGNVQWTAIFDPNRVEVQIDLTQNIRLVLSGLSANAVQNINDRNYVRLVTSDGGVANVFNQNDFQFTAVQGGNNAFETQFDVTGVFLGRAKIFVEIRGIDNAFEPSNESLEVIVLRPERLIDTMFSVTIIFLLAILFVNFGCAIDVKVMKEIFKRPVAPAIGSVCQLVFMPLIAYGLGWALFPNNPELALGLFLCGIAPAGGASNIWVLLLGGNLNLSISMTTISTLLCFGSMPLWLFILGRRIFERANLGVPYLQVALVAAALLIPLGIGLVIQKVFPRIAKFLVRILKPLSLVFIIIVIVLGLLTNLYLLELFAWQVIIASITLPLLGNLIGWVAGSIFRQPTSDTIAIAIETGVQNTGLTMFLITFALEQPAADITMVIPMGVSIITPVPLIIFVIIKKIRDRSKAKKLSNEQKEAPQPALESEQSHL